MDFRILDLIATIIAFCTPCGGRGRGHPPSETVRVLATLRHFLREGTPWRGWVLLKKGQQETPEEAALAHSGQTRR